MRRPQQATYHLRDGTAEVILRHHTDDTGVFAEIFRDGFYELPAPLMMELQRRGADVHFVDLGANIGLFGAWVLRSNPKAKVTAFEPDPATLDTLRRFCEINGVADRWTIVPACASNRSGTLRFLANGTSESRTASSDDDLATAIDVPAVDVFTYLEHVDILKIDIEGGEWDILLDPRFAAVPARAVLLEYHPSLCPTSDARRAAVDALSQAGYEVECLIDHPAGHGMLRAVR